MDLSPLEGLWARSHKIVAECRGVGYGRFDRNQIMETTMAFFAILVGIAVMGLLGYVALESK